MRLHVLLTGVSVRARAVSVARLGYRVALIDADIGLRNLDLLLGLENRVMYTAVEVLDGECRLEQALIRDKRWRNLVR
jgi:septum site-determining protein MinD